MDNNKSLYPTILFHFTSKKGLYGILKETFSISYSSEKIVGMNKSTEFAVPMVSFCDLKLSELKNMESYGSYGIGLTKEWANKNGLNPVFYANKQSTFTGNFIEAVEGLYNQLNLVAGMSDRDAAERNYMNILNAYRYIKNYEGDLKRKGHKLVRNYRFADEREWRYVPPLNETIYPFIPVTKMNTAALKREFNNLLSHLKLSFQPEDIKYLIIKSDDEISNLISHLEMVKERYDEETMRRLASRILTSEQINDDI